MNNGRRKPVKEKMLEMLDDGKPHSLSELRTCLWDEQSPESAVHAHLTAIRQQLRPKGHDIATIKVGGRLSYQLVRLVASSYQ